MVFSITQKEELKRFYDLNGYVTISDLLSRSDAEELQRGFVEAVEKKEIILDDVKPIECSDVVYRHPVFEKYVRNEKIISTVEFLIGRKGLELQHAKLNSKPLSDQGAGKVSWHQDYPFFPHTNLDLVAVGVHLDDEDLDSGPLKFIPKSHEFGVLSHCQDEKFVYECMDKNAIENHKSEVVPCKAGWVTIHHCLTLHGSEPKRNSLQRRLLVYQLRTLDNIQISGVLWRCTGTLLSEGEGKGYARFMDGTIVENRGKDGRLYDKFAKLGSNR